MKMKSRTERTGVSEHVVHWWQNREPCFFGHEDFQVYQFALSAASKKYNCDIHCYTLLHNHVHLLATPRGIWRLMDMTRSVASRYIRYFRKKYKGTRNVGEQRFRSVAVERNSSVLDYCRNIESSPVQQGLSGRPEHYPWSSYGHNAHGTFDPIVTQHDAYHLLGADRERQRTAYRLLFDVD